MARQLVFDLETQRSFQEVGGRKNFHRLGMSLAVTYDPEKGLYQTYREEKAAALIDALLGADEVIGFNVKAFDYEVLRGYGGTDFRRVKKTTDLLEVLHRGLGFRVSLDKLAWATLDEGKSGSGLLALRWYKEGNWLLLEKYCRRDVELTARLYGYGKEHGYLWYPAAGGMKKASVSW